MSAAGGDALTNQSRGRNATDWSLITVTHNSAAALAQFWATPLPGDVEWVVVDNRSSDGSAELAESLGARVIRLERNVGFGAANNVGFRATTAPLVGFVNPDVTVVPESLPTLAEVIGRTGGIVSPQLLNPDGSVQANGRGYPFLAAKIRNRLESDARPSGYRRYAAPDEDLPVVWFIGAVVLGQRATLQRLGGWDESFFVYYEDSDLGLRAASAGVPRIVCGRTRWVHGWARETKTLRWSAWRRELPSMWKFYSRYPTLLSLRPRRTGSRLAARGWPAP